MLLPWWLETFLEAPWYDKLLWLFGAGVVLFIAVVWIQILVQTFRVERSSLNRGPRANGAGGGFGESTTVDLMSFHSTSDSTSSGFSSDSSGYDSSGGSDFSGGGGDFGGGGASGGWT